MTSRPELPIGHPEFDDFLSASVGEDADGVGLSVMSALARLGLDPWSEAARLSDLPRDAAVTALAAMLGRLPAGSWKAKDLGRIADRPADSLPGEHRPVRPPAQKRGAAAPRQKAKATRGPLTWLLYGAIAIGFYIFIAQLQPERQLEPGSAESSQQ